MLQINDITKTYGTFRALDGVSLHVRRGTVFGLLGPNGAGKTTLIRIINHIISPDTLFPRNDYLSVSILCADSGLADALSTAVFNMDLESGLNYVNRMEGVEACWILADGEIRYSSGFEAYILP